MQQLYMFTTAVRDAANRDEVLDRVKAEAGVRPQYLSGEEEARLTYLALANHGFGDPDHWVITADKWLVIRASF